MQLIYGSKLKEKHDEFLYVNDANLSLPFGITYFEKSMPFLDNLSFDYQSSDDCLVSINSEDLTEKIRQC